MDQARWSVWDLPAALVPMNYVEAVQRAGGMAVLVPPDPALLDDPGAMLDHLDGLMLIGGPDVGAGALRRRAPPAGRARGAAARRRRDRPRPGGPRPRPAPAGDLPRHAAHQRRRRRHPAPAPARRARRRPPPARGGQLPGQRAPGGRGRGHAGAGERGREPAPASTPTTIRPWTGWGRGCASPARSSEGDGTPEAIEPDGAGWALGVQWHPEADPDSPVIAGLVAAARDRIALRREGVDRKEGGHSPIPAARRDERS